MPAALTLWAASLVPVNQDTLEMDLPAQVSHLTLHCYKAHAKISEKIETSISVKS